MKSILTSILCVFVIVGYSQTDLPKDFLKPAFHKERRALLRASLPDNSVAVFFANPIRNRANDVNFVYHQDPNFYYLTGLKEANSVLLIFSDHQTNEGDSFNELIYVQKRDADKERWDGPRLGTEGVGSKLGFLNVFNGEDFKDIPIDFSTFDKVLFEDFKNDVRDSKHDDADLYSLIAQFKMLSSYKAVLSKVLVDEKIVEVETNIDVRSLHILMASLREIKTEEELVLLKTSV